MLQHSIDERGVVTLTLDRPQLHNAFDDALIAELIRVLVCMPLTVRGARQRQKLFRRRRFELDATRRAI